MRHFYHSVINIESLLVSFEELDLSVDQRKHLATLTDSMVHHTVLDAILSELSEDDKQLFLEKLNENDHPEIWKFLNEKIDGVEDKIKKVADSLKDELHEDIKEARSKK